MTDGIYDGNQLYISRLTTEKDHKLLTLHLESEEIMSVSPEGAIKVHGDVTEDSEKIGEAFKEFAKQYAKRQKREE